MTSLRYLTDAYLFTSTANVIDTRILEDGRKAIILNETIFYPQGGGQPADHGTISSDNACFIVSDVRLDPDGTVLHIGSFENGSFDNGQRVSLQIDEQRRRKNSRLHSAGHLIDCAVSLLSLPLKPTKGYHFPEGAYVEYEGILEDAAQFIEPIQEKINELLDKDLRIIISELSAQEAQQKGIYVPQGKSARLVQFEGFEPCGCGGTHVLSAQEIGPITVRKIKSKKGATRISYDL